MKVFGFAYHAAGAAEHHKYEQCEVGAGIEPDKIIKGDGGLPLCKACDRIHADRRRNAEGQPYFRRMSSRSWLRFLVVSPREEVR